MEIAVLILLLLFALIIGATMLETRKIARKKFLGRAMEASELAPGRYWVTGAIRAHRHGAEFLVSVIGGGSSTVEGFDDGVRVVRVVHRDSPPVTAYEGQIIGELQSREGQDWNLRFYGEKDPPISRAIGSPEALYEMFEASERLPRHLPSEELVARTVKHCTDYMDIVASLKLGDMVEIAHGHGEKEEKQIAIVVGFERVCSPIFETNAENPKDRRALRHGEWRVVRKIKQPAVED